MSKRKPNDNRIYKTMRFNPDLVEKLEQAADERAVSFNWLVEKACEDFMKRLIPIDEVKWTKDDDAD